MGDQGEVEGEDEGKGEREEREGEGDEEDEEDMGDEGNEERWEKEAQCPGPEHLTWREA